MKSSRNVSENDTCVAASPFATDKEGMTPQTCKAARGLLGISQDELAERADVTALTIRKYETGKTGLAHRTWRAMRGALEKSGVVFIDENDDHGPGVMLKKVGDRNDRRRP
jgi:transcriptional regulator with XRE-family HTH domain